MRSTITIPLLVGLGARIFLRQVVFSSLGFVETGTTEHVIFGAWQGVLLYHLLTEQPQLVSGVACGVCARLLIDYVLVRDAVKSAATLLGAAVGVLCVDILSRLFDDVFFVKSGSGKTGSRSRAVQFNKQSTHERRSTRAHHHRDGRANANGHSIATAAPSLSLDSTTTDLESIESAVPTAHNAHLQTPLEREIAALRTRASVADGHRRRMREERRWALAQTPVNHAWASQLKWQIRRYKALAESFTREADKRLVEGVFCGSFFFGEVPDVGVGCARAASLESARIKWPVVPAGETPLEGQRPLKPLGHVKALSHDGVVGRSTTVDVNTTRQRSSSTPPLIRNLLQVRVRE